MTRKIALIIGFLILAQLTFATTYTQQETFSDITSFPTTITKTFDQFNPLSGTLDSIKITLNLDITGGQLRVDNDGPEVSAGNAYFGAEGVLSSSDVILKNASDNNIWDGLITCKSTFFYLAADNGDGSTADFNAPDGAVYNPQGSESNDVNDFINSIYFNDFIGTDTYDIILDIDQYVNTFAFPSIEYDVSDVTASGSIIIDYDYTIPEPTTLVLLGLGSLLLLRRRK